MRIREYFRFAGRDFGKRKVANILNILFFVIAAYLINVVLDMANMTQAERKIMELMTDRELERIGMVSVLEMNIEDPTLGRRINQLIEGLEDAEGVAGGGAYYQTDIRIAELKERPGLGEILQKNNIFFVSMYPDVVYADEDLLCLCKARLESGSMDDFSRKTENGHVPVIAGYDYKAILEQGEVLTDEISGKTYEVIGFLEQGNRFFENIDPGAGMDIYSTLDSYLVVPMWDGMDEETMGAACYMGNIYFYPEWEADMTKVMKEVSELAENIDIAVDVFTMDSYFDENMEDEDALNGMVYVLTYVVIVLAILAMIVAGMIQILTNQREYAIMLASGFRRGTLYHLIFLENLIKISVALLVGTYIQWTEIAYSKYLPSYNVDIFWHYDVPMVIGIFVAVAVLVTAIPVCLLRKVRISQLI